MATRSIIAIKINDKEYRSIYSHWDGYLDGVGVTLFNHYTTFEKVNDLINLGNISSLGQDLLAGWGNSHSFETPKPNVTVAYGRDRGDSGQEYLTHTLEKKIRCEEFLYLFKDEVWYYRTDRQKEFKLLTKELIE